MSFQVMHSVFFLATEYRNWREDVQVFSNWIWTLLMALFSLNNEDLGLILVVDFKAANAYPRPTYARTRGSLCPFHFRGIDRVLAILL